MKIVKQVLTFTTDNTEWRTQTSNILSRRLAFYDNGHGIIYL